MSESVCVLCGERIDVTATAWRRVAGWERPDRGASGRSGSSLYLREATGEIAHAECVTANRSGVHVRQETLV